MHGQRKASQRNRRSQRSHSLQYPGRARGLPSLPIHIRTPVSARFNDNDEDIRAIAEFVRESGCARYEPLAYHRLGTQKYRFLGLDYPLGDKELSEERFERLRQIAASLCPAPHGEGAA